MKSKQRFGIALTTTPIIFIVLIFLLFPFAEKEFDRRCVSDLPVETFSTVDWTLGQAKPTFIENLNNCSSNWCKSFLGYEIENAGFYTKNRCLSLGTPIVTSVSFDLVTKNHRNTFFDISKDVKEAGFKLRDEYPCTMFHKNNEQISENEVCSMSFRSEDYYLSLYASNENYEWILTPDEYELLDTYISGWTGGLKRCEGECFGAQRDTFIYDEKTNTHNGEPSVRITLGLRTKN